jgi:chemotaxis response regulator CheB
MAETLRVLVVDDSAYVRKVVSQMLGRSPSITVVGAARDGAEALEMVDALKPDVITCDLNMPVMDGVAFVRAQMARRPVPIVIISIAAESGEQVLAALDAGAVDFVQKPTALATERLLDIADELTEKVKAAGESRQRMRTIPPAPARVRVPRRLRDLDRRTAGVEDPRAAIACRLPGADRDGDAHAARVYRDVRAEARRDVAAARDRSR